ncbi:hypothetical protein GCK32_003273 [Trichostrongylus colubriformis]|uniref:Uncharacterized protein n=1 Tax=Trichostrongylus colubriformis TaxID=6319 RepID=A0AAN8EXS2_TRICO
MSPAWSSPPRGNPTGPQFLRFGSRSNPAQPHFLRFG